jgi:Zn-dependent peptidase ImmA (M78 family)
VFINGADTKASQMFTLAHEMAHVWLGESGVSDSIAPRSPTHRLEKWCNQVAAELLVPLAEFRRDYDRHAPLQVEMPRLARYFTVSTVVALRRMHDAGGLSVDRMWEEYEREVRRLVRIPRSSGGNFYLTLAARASRRFARGLVASTLEGRTSFSEAFRLLGFKKMATFNKVGESLGVLPRGLPA